MKCTISENLLFLICVERDLGKLSMEDNLEEAVMV